MASSGDPTTPPPGESGLIHVRYSKWDGSLHWHFDMWRLGEDGHGVWLGAPHGTPVQRGDREPIISPAFALLIPANAYWTGTFNVPVPDSPFPYDIYVDVCTPVTWEGSTATAIDLDLDVVRTPDGAVSLHDEDEFDEHRRRFGYPPYIVDSARSAAASTFTAIESGTEPFATVGSAWLKRAKAL